ncbi:MAG: glycosyltransferase [Pseudomonadota bacterium]
MTARAPHILFHRPTPWSSDIQCSTKVLATLCAEAGCDVTYLQAPYDPISIVRNPSLLAEWRTLPRDDKGVRIVGPITPVSVRDVWPLSTRIAANLRYLATPGLRRTIASPKGAPDLIWTTVPGSATALRTLFPEARHVFHVIDYYPAFRGDRVQVLEQADYQSADEVFVIGQTLKDYLIADLGVAQEKVSVLGQGVDARRFESDLETPDDISKLRGPIAIWVGVLKKGDPALFNAAAAALSAAGGSLVLIGPGAPWSVELAKSFPEVVHLLGPLPAELIPAYLKSADLGLMLYDRAMVDVYRGQNPLKLYEYASAGLPIISTDHDEYGTLKPPVSIVSTPEETSNAIEALLGGNRKSVVRAVTEFSKQHDWRTKVSILLGRYFPDHQCEVAW